MCVTKPMGWSYAVNLAQSVHEHVLPDAVAIKSQLHRAILAVLSEQDCTRDWLRANGLELVSILLLCLVHGACVLSPNALNPA